ncbi:Macrophage migration inhibitory factor [Sesamum alatum]|uniref:Macrophage migration inhibitory factor n=1 Tax=Sesamum alatum TaxID=300844 RepID=A0AAE2CRY4_9LAMI|nr:Macrophage migration inhibitory factor [Sesamum alatum]
MPCLNLSTNVSLEGVDTSSILSEASSTVAKIIGKPEAVPSKHYSHELAANEGSVPMAFGGTEQPAAYGELVSIGGLSPDVNKKLSGAIANILETKLSVPKSRFYLKFYDTKARKALPFNLFIKMALSCSSIFSLHSSACLGLSDPRKCTMSACFTPVLNHGSNLGWNGATF